MRETFKRRIEKLTRNLERENDVEMRWPIFEDILAILNALDRGNEEFLEKFHPKVVAEFRKIHQKHQKA
jgi:hypothetical protein